MPGGTKRDGKGMMRENCVLRGSCWMGDDFCSIRKKKRIKREKENEEKLRNRCKIQIIP